MERDSRPLWPADHGALLLDTAAPGADEAAGLLMQIGELSEAAGRIHTYKLTTLSLWQAAAQGFDAGTLQAALSRLLRGQLPAATQRLISRAFSSYGQLTLSREGEALLLRASDAELLTKLLPKLAELALERRDDALIIDPAAHGTVKSALLRAGYPVLDLVPPLPGTPLPLELRASFQLRPYQQQAVARFAADGSGVMLLPCGAGKTSVALGALAALQTQMLVLCPSNTSIAQWRAELLAKTTIQPEQIGEWSGERKELRPVTLATYQVATRQSSGIAHIDRLSGADWGLVVYDEVHLLPAPVFRLAAQLQARRRLGLTATLVREDGREREVFSLIGPLRFTLPWKELEAQGWIAPASCAEIRVALPERQRRAYIEAEEPQSQSRIAAENPAKLAVVRELLLRHRGEQILIIGQYLAQLDALAKELGAPLLTGRTPQAEREQLYADFRSGATPVLIVSKVANVAVDLPDASVAIQISGAFGSRQEEAQRLGRLLRPKRDGRHAYFYTIVSSGTREESDAARRQRFLVEQGYGYELAEAVCTNEGEGGRPRMGGRAVHE